MYESLTIVGNLGRDPEMRYTPSDKAVTNFSVAVNTRWTNSNGEPGERVTWYKVACWGKLAEITNQYLAKGRKVMVVASRIEAEAYIDGEGQPRAALKVTADTVKFLDANGDTQPVAEEQQEEIPF
ncbi:MAG: single-stranded DNA-binding protein [Anaerolineae bacterium]|nr:single-stranded DNA-binding protein [Anaerolineae bacterium]